MLGLEYLKLKAWLMVSAQIAYFSTRRYGAYGPLLLAPAEGLGALWAPCHVGIIYLKYNFVNLILVTP